MSAVKDSGSDLEPPQFFYYARLVYHMMRKIGYNLQCGDGLNFERGRCGLLWTFGPKGKQQIIMIKHTGGWDMLHLPLCSSPKKKNLSRHIPLFHLSGNQTLMWGCSSRTSVNMTSINQLEYEEAIETFETDPWAQQLDLNWEKRFEQCEPPTEDRVTQVDLGSPDHYKPISISESQSLMEREELIALIRKYIDIFA